MGVSSISADGLRGPGVDSELLESRVGVQADVGELSIGASSNSETLVKGAGW